MRFDSDRAGPDAAVLRFEETCDLSGSAAVPSGDSRIDRYERVETVGPGYSASWYAVVEGGCWWWDFRFRSGASPAFAAEIDGAIRSTSRDDINATLADDIPDESI